MLGRAALGQRLLLAQVGGLLLCGDRARAHRLSQQRRGGLRRGARPPRRPLASAALRSADISLLLLVRSIHNLDAIVAFVRLFDLVGFVLGILLVLVEPVEAPLESVGRTPLPHGGLDLGALGGIVLLHRLNELSHFRADLLAYLALDAGSSGLRLIQALPERIHLGPQVDHVNLRIELAAEVGLVVALLLNGILFEDLALALVRGRRSGFHRILLGCLDLGLLLGLFDDLVQECASLGGHADLGHGFDLGGHRRVAQHVLSLVVVRRIGRYAHQQRQRTLAVESVTEEMGHLGLAVGHEAALAARTRLVVPQRLKAATERHQASIDGGRLQQARARGACAVSALAAREVDEREARQACCGCALLGAFGGARRFRRHDGDCKHRVRAR